MAHGEQEHEEKEKCQKWFYINEDLHYHLYNESILSPTSQELKHF